MNSNVKKLAQLAAKQKRTIIGLMSGTSLDGLDVALCTIEGSGLQTKLSLSNFETVAYDQDFRDEVRSVFSKETVNLQKLCLLNEWIAGKHAKMINDCLAKWNMTAAEVDLIASHGQTIYHAPYSLHGLKKFGNGTLQIGDGDHLAVSTGIITLSDFRQKHLAAGGEGAPLAAYGDFILFSDDSTNVVLLNIGGIANFTFLPKNAESGIMFSSDTGPGNTMMDGFMQDHFKGKHYDDDATLGRQGTVSHPLLQALLANNFLKQPLPKTTGPELFNAAYLEEALKRAAILRPKDADLMTTLNRFSAITIADALNDVIKEEPCKIYVSGGGMHNPLLMDYLKQHVKTASFHSTAEKDINPDAKEAVLFAVLANEAVAGNPLLIPTSLENFPAVSMGKISFPE